MAPAGAILSPSSNRIVYRCGWDNPGGSNYTATSGGLCFGGLITSIACSQKSIKPFMDFWCSLYSLGLSFLLIIQVSLLGTELYINPTLVKTKGIHAWCKLSNWTLHAALWLQCWTNWGNELTGLWRVNLHLHVLMPSKQHCDGRSTCLHPYSLLLKLTGWIKPVANYLPWPPLSIISEGLRLTAGVMTGQPIYIYICVCVCVCVCMYMCVYIHIYIYIYMCVCV